jgi:hypothetical protein
VPQERWTAAHTLTTAAAPPASFIYPQPQGDGKSGGPKADDKQVQDYIAALEKGGVKREMARDVLKKWEEAGADGGDPKTLRKLFLKQSAVPALAAGIQVCAWGGAAAGARPGRAAVLVELCAGHRQSAAAACVLAAGRRGGDSHTAVRRGVAAQQHSTQNARPASTKAAGMHSALVNRHDASSPTQTLVDAAATYSIFTSAFYFA